MTTPRRAGIVDGDAAVSVILSGTGPLNNGSIQMLTLPSLRSSRFDWVLFGSVVLLVLFGLAALYSTSLGAGGVSGATTADFSNFWKQVTFASVGLVLALGIATFDHRGLAGYSKFLYVVSFLLLVAVLLFGRTVRGTTGWFGIGGFGIQPAELVKLFVIIFMAKFFADYARDPDKIRNIVRSGASLALLIGLVMLQPDFGSAALMVAVWGSLLLISGVRRSHLVIMAVLAVVAVIIGWAFVLKPYQKDRITSFWDPDADPLGRGYNVTQSVIAIGSGELFGKGLGYGSQSQLRFLPERQTDFIFAVIAEELGFFGVFVLLALFGTVFWRGYRLAVTSRDDFTMFLTLGITVSLAVEVFVNLGANLRLLPVTGVTLPFVSYGGSSLLVKFMMLGILESVAVRR